MRKRGEAQERGSTTPVRLLLSGEVDGFGVDITEC